VIVPVFKTGGRQVFLSPVGSTPTRFRHLFSIIYAVVDLISEVRPGPPNWVAVIKT
jgi:hypothetical protein